MNYLTNTRNISKLNENELKAGIFDHKISWHADYSHSAYIYIGGLPFDLTEGDIICVFSQYGEIVTIHLVRDHKTGKSKGYCFLAYEDQRSTILAVDNFNGIKLGGRIIRVDHVSEFKPPKSGEKDKFGNKLLLTPKDCSRGAPKILDSYQKKENHNSSSIVSKYDTSLSKEDNRMRSKSHVTSKKSRNTSNSSS